VEYGSECFCGYGYEQQGEPVAINTSQCSYACSGDPNLTCGGSYAVQVYTSQ
jgi:hypothetical protein